MQKRKKAWRRKGFVQYGKEMLLQQKWMEFRIYRRKKKGLGMKNEIWVRNKDIQRQKEESKIQAARYNQEFKKIMMEQGFPGYLREDKEENEREKPNRNYVRALMRTRCGNMEEEKILAGGK